jgi:hypothetical protein
MSSLSLQSHRSQIFATAVAASLSTVGVVYAWNALSKQRKRRELNDEIRRSIAANGAARPHSPDIDIQLQGAEDVKILRSQAGFEYDEELLKEQLARNYAFFGEEGMQKIRGGSVVVVGAGGVGSWAAVMLVRS